VRQNAEENRPQQDQVLQSHSCSRLCDSIQTRLIGKWGTNDTGKFSGFEVAVRSPGIAWITFNTPERLNGMTTAIKRDLIEAVTQAQMDNRFVSSLSRARAARLRRR
jgi:hypothetical protein